MIVRSGPKVERARAATLDQALDELEARTRAAATARGRTGTLDLRIRSFEPGEQVIVRGELRGPGRFRPAVQAGIDVRGDGDAAGLDRPREPRADRARGRRERLPGPAPRGSAGYSSVRSAGRVR